jgi:hypothetical protein
MAVPNQQITPISEEQERAIITYATQAQNLLIAQFQLRSSLEEIDRNYMREADATTENMRAKIANRIGDKKKFQDVTVPIIMPQVEAALGYMANVFCTGYPVFGVSADPATEDQALQMETIIAENAVTANWVRQMLMFFRDGLKYNIHALECEWQQKKVWTVSNNPTAPNGAQPTETMWAGNVLRRMDLYNTFFDPRVHPSEVHSEGEYAGYIELMSRVRMKKYINDLFGKVSPSVVKKAFESGGMGGAGSSTAPFNYYRPIINPFPIMARNSAQTFDWMSWAFVGLPGGGKEGIRYNNAYQVTKMYARIIPNDFGFAVPEKNTPQVWKFILVNGQVVLFAEKQSNAHNFIPIFFGQPIEDGLDYQTKSFATNVGDLQDIASAMWNGFIASKRRLVGDRVLYDPLRVREKDINSTNPAAKIPVRPSAYGKPVGESVYQFPYRDEQTNSFIQGATAVQGFADLVNGQNPAQQGQFQKGNKTKSEYEDVMGHGNTRNQTMGMMTEGQVFVPLKETIKLNILQYQEEVTLFNSDKNQQVPIKPVDLRSNAVHFKINDGMLPAEKQMSTDEFQVALQTLMSAPSIAAAYNIAPMITYLFKVKGADLRPFEKPQVQVLYEQQTQQWQQMAMAALQKGVAFNVPQPTIPPELQQLQAQGPAASPTSAALESTTGTSTPTASPSAQRQAPTTSSGGQQPQPQMRAAGASRNG